MIIQVTKHAEERGKSRLGLSKRAVLRQAQLAYERGYPHSHTKGNLRKWIDKEATKLNCYASDYVVYNSGLFIFRNVDDAKILITVLNIPSNLTRNLKSYIK